MKTFFELLENLSAVRARSQSLQQDCSDCQGSNKTPPKGSTRHLLSIHADKVAEIENEKQEAAQVAQKVAEKKAKEEKREAEKKAKELERKKERTRKEKLMMRKNKKK
jgi:hypothetical protein